MREFVDHFGQVLCRTGQLQGLTLSEAQDATQESFAIFFKKAEEVREDVRFSTFLFGIFYNVVREQKRKRGKAEFHGDMEALEGLIDRDYDDRGHWTDASAPAPLERLLEQENLAKFRECLETLPDRHRGALLAQLESDLDAKELCHTLGLSYVNLRQLLSRARQALKVCLENHVRGERA